MRKRIQLWLWIGLIILLLISILLMFYPLIASWYSKRNGSQVHSEFVESVKEINTYALDAVREAAEQFNQDLKDNAFDPLNPNENGYYKQLDPTGTGIMGYISIPSIDVYLPILHGTSSEVLQSGAGHMPQSSLPIGGNTTHAVITAHSGMASNPMFTDITLLKPGDIFQIEVLDEVLTYQIQSESDIKIVEPENIEDIQLVKGEDLCTLITCYPFGVNTERYLVRGHRIPTPEKAEDTTCSEADATVPEENAGSTWQERYWQRVCNGFLIAVALLIFVCSTCFVEKKYRQSKEGRDKQ